MFKTERVMRVQSCCFADLKQLFTEVEVVSDGKYPPLAADTEVNNCFSIYESSEIIEHKIKMMDFKKLIYCCQRQNLARKCHVSLPTNYTFQGICLAIMGKFL